MMMMMMMMMMMVMVMVMVVMVMVVMVMVMVMVMMMMVMMMMMMMMMMICCLGGNQDSQLSPDSTFLWTLQAMHGECGASVAAELLQLPHHHSNPDRTNMVFLLQMLEHSN